MRSLFIFLSLFLVFSASAWAGPFDYIPADVKREFIESSNAVRQNHQDKKVRERFLISEQRLLSSMWDHYTQSGSNTSSDQHGEYLEFELYRNRTDNPSKAKLYKIIRNGQAYYRLVGADIIPAGGDIAMSARPDDPRCPQNPSTSPMTGSNAESLRDDLDLVGISSPVLTEQDPKVVATRGNVSQIRKDMDLMKKEMLLTLASQGWLVSNGERFDLASTSEAKFTAERLFHLDTNHLIPIESKLEMYAQKTDVIRGNEEERARIERMIAGQESELAQMRDKLPKRGLFSRKSNVEKEFDALKSAMKSNRKRIKSIDSSIGKLNVERETLAREIEARFKAFRKYWNELGTDHTVVAGKTASTRNGYIAAFRPNGAMFSPSDMIKRLSSQEGAINDSEKAIAKNKKIELTGGISAVIDDSGWKVGAELPAGDSEELGHFGASYVPVYPLGEVRSMSLSEFSSTAENMFSAHHQ